MSDLEFIPIHKIFQFVTVSSIKYMKNANSDMISFHVYNNSAYKITLPLALLGYCETNTTIFSPKEVAYRVNNILQLLDICQSTILDEELSINNTIIHKSTLCKPTFQMSNYTEAQSSIFNTLR